MSTLYKVILVQLNGDASRVIPSSEKLDIGQVPTEEVFRLSDNLLKLDVTQGSPSIVVQRGDKGCRIAVHSGRLRVYKSTSLLDEYWTVENAAALTQIPLFAASVASAAAKTTRSTTKTKNTSVVRTVAEVAGLFAVGVALILVGFHFGFPQKKLTDLPNDIIVITAPGEQSSVFNAVAGSYVTGKKVGESMVVITPDGRVSLGPIGKDGKLTKPRIEEQARAGRRGSLAVILTSFGVIAETPPDAVNVGNTSSTGARPWRKQLN